MIKEKTPTVDKNEWLEWVVNAPSFDTDRVGIASKANLYPLVGPVLTGDNKNPVYLDASYRPAAYDDLQGVEFLSPVIDGYMTSPVCVYDGNPLTAKTVSFTDIKAALDEFMSSGRRIFIYRLMFFPICPSYYGIDSETFAPFKLDSPKFTSLRWFLRFAELSDTFTIPTQKADTAGEKS